MNLFLLSVVDNKNSLKNDAAKKKADKKDKDKDGDADQELTDAEKDAMDYQLQRAMDMVRALDKIQRRAVAAPADPNMPVGTETQSLPQTDIRAEKSDTDKKQK